MIKGGVLDPHQLLDTEDDGGGAFAPGEVPIIDLPQPDHRLSSKQPPPEMRGLRGPEPEEKPVIGGWKMKTLIQKQEQKAKLYYDMGKFDLASCAEVLEDMVITPQMKTKARGAQTSSMILGAYIHGGMRGITKAGKRRPHLTKYLNMVLRSRVAEDLGEDGSWTTLGLFRASDIPPHRDLRNQM